MRILLDIDGVVADFISHCMPIIKAICGSIYEHNDINQYQIERVFNLDTGQTEQFREAIKMANWLRRPFCACWSPPTFRCSPDVRFGSLSPSIGRAKHRRRPGSSGQVQAINALPDRLLEDKQFKKSSRAGTLKSFRRTQTDLLKNARKYHFEPWSDYIVRNVNLFSPRKGTDE